MYDAGIQPKPPLSYVDPFSRPNRRLIINSMEMAGIFLAVAQALRDVPDGAFRETSFAKLLTTARTRSRVLGGFLCALSIGRIQRR